MRRPRAAIVVTGSELVRGDRADRNGPFLAAEALRLGLEPEWITIVGDAPEDLARALAQAFEADLCLVSSLRKPCSSRYASIERDTGNAPRGCDPQRSQ